MVQSILPETFNNDVFLTIFIFGIFYMFAFFIYFGGRRQEALAFNNHWNIHVRCQNYHFVICLVNPVFEKGFGGLFVDLINAKGCTCLWKLLNLSDLQRVAKTFFKNAICLLTKLSKTICESKVVCTFSGFYSNSRFF